MNKKVRKSQITGILGYGEIGTAMARISREAGDICVIKDIDQDQFDGKINILHVCISYQDSFIEQVNELVDKHDISLVIVHSTVAVGTTERIKNAVHSPIRGIHPYLYGGIKEFVKYIGADNEKLAKETASVFKRYGIKFKVFNNPRTTELNKLLDTAYYGICIEAHRFFKEACDFYDVDFDSVAEFNETYNEGYKKLKKRNVVRPVLSAPAGKIGGHCILPNIEILQQDLKSEFLDDVFKANFDRVKDDKK